MNMIYTSFLVRFVPFHSRAALELMLHRNWQHRFIRLFQSLFFSGTKVHYRKRGQTNSFEDKKASVGIIYHSEDDTVRINGRSFPLKPIRKNDVYMQEAMTRKIKYCRVVRKYKDGKCIFFVQFVMEGVPSEKHRLGKGICGVDEGVSTVCFINDAETDFVVLAKGVEKYDKAIHDASVSYERKMRLNNPDCYNSDGTLKKGAKLKVRSKNSFKALMQLKSAYRKKRFLLSNNIIVLQIGSLKIAILL